jgi:hypothetical protein
VGLCCAAEQELVKQNSNPQWISARKQSSVFLIVKIRSL